MAPVPELEDLLSTVDDRCSTGSEMDRLHAAMDVAREVSRLGDDLVTHFVEQARQSGASWADIGAALGVSRQGAHQRLRDRPQPQRWWRADTARWTDRARRAMAFAVKEARTSGHGFIGTEHLLLGILDVPENVGLAALEGCGADPAALRTAVRHKMEVALDPVVDGERLDHLRAAVEGKPATAASGGRRPRRQRFTPCARRVVDLAAGESLALGHNFVGCEHLTIALAQGEGMAAEVLGDAGIDAQRLRDKVVELLCW